MKVCAAESCCKTGLKGGVVDARVWLEKVSRCETKDRHGKEDDNCSFHRTCVPCSGLGDLFIVECDVLRKGTSLKGRAKENPAMVMAEEAPQRIADDQTDTWAAARNEAAASEEAAATHQEKSLAEKDT
ncbi:hypothetical protein CfE428DRAFT_3936 [Chthoniobacter flavus Ellin428]|uniref:Uncharacterized protein n=1 Tax=Chthoniobacter flavus Ellin428 TaxID=497964 RepID=B4D4U8_9BACT|nr:hypothetical protein CfE428DRAFT_3936 [Chthoniobacter flavus Ellin428]TCO90994.1 hypothetical protein EV701_109144 [Chthoniobacter flavus]